MWSPEKNQVGIRLTHQTPIPSMRELKRWLMGTHQGAVSHKHPDYYLDEFTFRFNRRRSKSRGKVFFRLAQQAVAVDPVTHYRIVCPDLSKAEGKPQSIGSW